MSAKRIFNGTKAGLRDRSVISLLLIISILAVLLSVSYAVAVGNSGPVTSGLSVVPIPSSSVISISATENDDLTTVAAAEYYFDECGTAGTGHAMAASDGIFDTQTEGVEDLDVMPLDDYGYILPDGMHTVCVRGRDDEGLWGDCECRSFELDKMAPDNPTDMALNGDSWVKELLVCDDDPILTGYVCDGESQLQAAEYFVNNVDDFSVFLNWQGNPLDSSDEDFDESCEDVDAVIDISGLEDGTHYVKFHAKDRAENWGKLSGFEPVSFIKDTTAPVTSKELTPYLGDKVDCYGTEEADADVVAKGALTDGCYYVKQGTQITLTAEDPDPQGTGEFAGNVVIYYRVWWKLNAGDEWQLSQEGHSEVNGSVNITLINDSYHLIEYWSVDLCGEEEEHHFELDIVDTVGPEGVKLIGEPKIPSLEDGFDFWVRDHVTEITLDCFDPEPHPVDHEEVCYRISFDDQQNPWLTEDYCSLFGGSIEGDYCCADVSGESFYNFTFQEDSLHGLEYYCRDELGNENEKDLEFFKVDSQPPIITKTLEGPRVGECPPENPTDECWIRDWTDLDGTTIQVTAEDDDTYGCAVDDVVCSWNYLLDGVSMQGETELPPSFDIKFYEDTVHEVHIECCDALGNCYEDVETFYLDSQGPTVEKTLGEPLHTEDGVAGTIEWITTHTPITLTATDLPDAVCAVGEDRIYYKNTVVSDEYCNEPETYCLAGVAPSNLLDPINDGWALYEGTFNKDEESCHLLEFYAVDQLGNVGPTGTNCFFVDDTPPEGTKEVGEPNIPIPEDIEELGNGGAGWSTEEVHSGIYSAKLVIPDNAAGTDFAGVDSFFDVFVNLDQVTSLSYYRKVIQYDNGWSPIVILGIDADGDGVFEAQPLEWEASLSAGSVNPSLLGDDSFIQCESPIGLSGVDTDFLQVDAYNNFQCYTPNFAGDGYEGYNLLSYFQTNNVGRVETTDGIAMVKIELGGNPTTQDNEIAFVDQVEINGKIVIDEPTWYWVRDHATEITLDCIDPEPHPVDHEEVCYRISFDVEPWLTQNYCSYTLQTDDEWCCVDVSGEAKHTIVFEEDSLHGLEYYCRDELGNENEVDIEYFKVDSVPPVTTKTYLGPFYNDSVTGYHYIDTASTVQLTALDGGEVCAVGVDEIQYRVSASLGDSVCHDCANWTSTGMGEWQTYSVPFPIEEESCHVIEYRSIDLLGNTEEIRRQCVFVDKTAPVTTKTYDELQYSVELPDYSFTETVTVSDGTVGNLEVAVEEDGDWMVWTFDFPVEGFTGDGNLNVGLIIATDGEGNGPAFQIHNNDGATGDFPHGTWLMSPWGPTISDGGLGWHSSDINTPVTDLSWVEATGNRNVPHNNGIMEIRIKKSELGNSFHWAASPTVGSGFYSPAYDVTMQIPTAFSWGTPLVDMAVPNYVYVELAREYPKWITSDTEITLTADDPQPHPAGIKETSYRVTLLGSDEACEDVQVCQQQEGTGDWSTYSSPFTIGEDSCHLIEYYSVDNVDKTETVKKQCVFVDNLAPESGKSFDGVVIPCDSLDCSNEAECDNYITQDTKIILTCEDQDPHPVNDVKIYYKYSVDDVLHQDWAEYTGSIQYDEDSKHTLEWYCVDALGNTESTHIQIERVDTKAPLTVKTFEGPTYPEDLDQNGTIDGEEEQHYWITSDTQITLISADEKLPCASGPTTLHYEVWWDSDCDGTVNEQTASGEVTTDQNCELSTTFSFDEECLHEIRWHAEDELGNIEQEHVQQHKVDNTPPHILILKPVDGWYSEGEDIPVVAAVEDLTNPHGRPCDEDDILSGKCAVGIEDGKECNAYLIDLLPEFDIIELETHMAYDADAHECQGYVTIPEGSDMTEGAVFFAVRAEDNLGNEGDSMAEILHSIIMSCEEDDFECIMDVVQDIVTIWNLPKIGIDNTAPLVDIMEPAEDAELYIGALDVNAMITDAEIDGDVTSAIKSGTPCYVTLGGVALGTLPYDTTTGSCQGTVDVPESVPDGTIDLEVSITDTAGNMGSGAISVDVIKDTAITDVTITNPTAGTSTGASFELNAETDETAACEYDVDSSGSYTLMANTNSITHSTVIGPLTDGQHTIDVRCIDPLGSPYGTDSVTWTVITSGPTSTITDILPDPADSDVTMTGGFASSTSVIAAAKYKIGLTGAPVAILAADLGDGAYGSSQETFSTVIPIGSLSEGINTVYLTAQDANGEWGIWTEEEVFVDTEDPKFDSLNLGDWYSGTLTISTSGNAADTEKVAFKYSPDEGSTWYPITSDWDLPFEAQWDTTSVDDGLTYRIRATAYDHAGNDYYRTDENIYIDNTPPVVTITNPLEGSEVSGVVSIVYTAADAGVGTITSEEISVDGAAWVPTIANPHPWDTTNKEDASHTIQIRATDDLGNIGYSSTLVYIVDNEAPQTALIITPTEGEIVDGNVAIEAAVSDSTFVQKVEFYIDGNLHDTDSDGPWTTAWNTVPADDGSHTLYAIVYDDMSNTLQSPTVNFVVNNLKPTGLSILIDGGAEYTTSTPVTLALSATNANDCRFSNDGQDWSAYEAYGASKSWTLTDGDGTKTVYYQCKDDEGSVSETVTDTIKLDETDPNFIAVTASPDPAKDGVTVTISFTASEGLTANPTVLVDGGAASYDGKDGLTYTYTYDVTTGDAEGSAAISITGIDLAGNPGTDTAGSFAIDYTEPSITDFSPTTDQNSLSVTLTAETNEDAICRYGTSDVGYEDMSDAMAGTETLHTMMVKADEGSNTYYVACKDEAGNGQSSAQNQEITFNADASAPEILAFGPAGLVDDKSQTLTVTTDEDAVCKYSTTGNVDFTTMTAMDGTGTAHTKAIDANEGLNVHYVKCSDRTYVMNSPLTFLFTVDTTDPSITITSPATLTNSKQVIFSITDSTSGVDKSSITVTLTGGDPTDFDADTDCVENGHNGFDCSYTESGMTESTTKIEIDADDNVKNSAVTAEKSFTYDETNPDATVAALQEYSSSPLTVSWSAVEANGVAEYELQYKKDAGSWETWVTTSDTSAVFMGDEGSYYEFEVRALDNAGNQELFIDTLEANTEIDSLPPMVTDSSPTGTVSSSSVTLSVTTSEGANCQYKLNEEFDYGTGTDFATTGGTTHTQPLTLEDGDYTYHVRCIDLTAGNKMTSSAIVDFDVDTSSNYGFAEWLNPVWSVFSLPKIILQDIGFSGSDFETQNVLSSLDGSYDWVYYYDGSVWLYYDPSDPLFSTLTTVEDTSGRSYYIKMNSRDRLEISTP